ncbi:MAG: neutral zinc metallopeptidase [Kiritimatiellae bacterium]|nr:neutral zinc metallopeptidase [Kiritimatiellia bacterium]NLD90324.1 metalloprotease [Lentisphaerota bacterium]HOU21729.1 neutral zinc metallopeptidase [Kiritimatiellia bacterium]HPC19894.1 neutral zinc metallopeptidase [Kiritimatiellia bacterium]
MLWKGRRESANVVDRRSVRAGTVAAGGLGTVVLVVLYLLAGGSGEDLQKLLPATQPSATSQPLTPAQEEAGQFVAVILAETEDVWHSLLDGTGVPYREPKLVLFSGATESGCGFAQSAIGPFYCSADESIYMDLDFLSDLQNRLGADGDFAVAYIIAHEVGHHVQHLLGILGQVNARRGGRQEAGSDSLSVRLELQADFLAGVWAHYAHRTKGLLEPGDVEEGVAAAGAVGDDRIQRQSQGYVVPDSFTHGTSAQRTAWFMKGFQTGDVSQGDTFATQEL